MVVQWHLHIHLFWLASETPNANSVVVYPERLGDKYDKTTLRRKFVHAASRAQFEWCMNSARFMSTLPKTLESFLAVGTKRNENLHARLNAQYRQIEWIPKRCLSAEIETWSNGPNVSLRP